MHGCFVMVDSLVYRYKTSEAAAPSRQDYAMICRIVEWIARPRRPIRLPRPSGLILITGAKKESIHAIFDDTNRMIQLVVHTRQKSLM